MVVLLSVVNPWNNVDGVAIAIRLLTGDMVIIRIYVDEAGVDEVWELGELVRKTLEHAASGGGGRGSG